MHANLILMLTAAALAFNLWVNPFQGPSDYRTEIFKFQDRDIERMDFSWPGGAYELSRTGSGWTVKADDKAYPADLAISGSLASAAAGMTAVRIFASGEGPDAKECGFEAPSASLFILTADGSSAFVEFGSASPSGSGLYSRISQKSKGVSTPPLAAVVIASQSDYFRRSTLELADRRIFDENTMAFTSFEVAKKGEVLMRFEKDSIGRWAVVHPVRWPGNWRRIFDFLYRIDTLPVKGVDRSPRNPESDAPDFEVSYASAARSGRVSFRILGEQGIECRSLVTGSYLLLDPSALGTLSADPMDFVSSAGPELSASRMRKIIIGGPGAGLGSTDLVKSSFSGSYANDGLNGKGPVAVAHLDLSTGAWRVERTGERDFSPPPGAVENLVKYLSAMKARVVPAPAEGTDYSLGWLTIWTVESYDDEVRQGFAFSGPAGPGEAESPATDPQVADSHPLKSGDERFFASLAHGGAAVVSGASVEAAAELCRVVLGKK